MRRTILILIILPAIVLFDAVFFRHGNAYKTDKSTGDRQAVKVIILRKDPLETTLRLPGDLLPYEAVDVYAKVSGFIEKIPVDRGSEVRKGEILAQLSVPELDRNIDAMHAQYLAAKDLYRRNKQMGVPIISPAALEASKDAVDAARSSMEARQEQKNYLTVRAPFDGVITSRNLHTGALVVAGGSNGAVPIFRLEKIATLRLTLAVPEAQVESVKPDAEVSFTVPALPDRKFTAKVARIAHSLDQKTRTEAVELDVDNADRSLSSGMYADVQWPVVRDSGGFTVPVKAVATTTEKTFVIRIKDGVTEWVEVKRGNAAGDNVEVFGNLAEGDTIAARATDELKEGVKVDVEPAGTTKPTP